jgi:4-carboxymuconolactone decarboxylase
MRLLAVTFLSLSLFQSASVLTDQAANAASATASASGDDAPAITVTRRGTETPLKGPAENFTGSVRIERLIAATGASRLSGASVSFEPGARTAWHTHPMGQTLFVTAGVGRVQGWGGPIEEIRPGDVVRIPPGQKHWHGASPNTAMTHVAIAEALDGKTVEWMEKVGDREYGAPVTAPAPGSPAPAAVSASSGEVTRAQRLMGDFAPKLAELTDKVLYDDVWARPQLSPRDRSLVTVSALIALHRPDQLRSHLARARDNGVTEDELVETITHLAFYAGWPSAVTAVSVAKEVFQQK